MMLIPDLFSFAYVPNWYSQLDMLADMALPEPWRFHSFHSDQTLDGMDYEGELFVSPADPEVEVLKREETARLLRAMESLSPDQRDMTA